LKGAREYFRIIRRLEKEKRNEEFLVEKMVDSETDLVQVRKFFKKGFIKRFQ